MEERTKFVLLKYTNYFWYKKSMDRNHLDTLETNQLYAMRNDISLIIAKRTNEYRLYENEIEMLKTNSVIEAIKSVRVRLNIGLKDAKDLVDIYRKMNSNL